VDENGSPPNQPAALSGASGFDGYRALYPATNEYEVCFKCHADSPNKPQNEFDYLIYGHTSRRQAETRAPDPKNLRVKFASSFSRHNVTQSRRLNHMEVPSLRESIVYPDNNRGRELVVGTYIYCSDCHLSNDAARLGGTGANGPHGSAYPHILGARYQQENPPVVPGEESGGGVQYVAGTSGSYALCNLCHDIENSILADESFSEHRRHIVEERTPCATCHDPHGVQETLGTPENNASLINFDLTIVAPDSLGMLYFDGLSRECYLSCHGVEHSPAQY
jgi:nitrate/TMAO reductase-like tetraheme cytochrome c subunit